MLYPIGVDSKLLNIGLLLLTFKMEKWTIITIGLIIGYFLFRLIDRKQKNSTDTYSDVLMNDKYKVKGQWER